MANKKKSGTPARTRKAIGDVGKKVEGVEIRRFTIGMATVLEEIGSALVKGKKPETNVEIVESIFAMTRSAEESLRLLAKGRAAYKMAAIVWADGLDLDESKVVITACLQSIVDACGAASGGSEGNAVSGVTDG